MTRQISQHTTQYLVSTLSVPAAVATAGPRAQRRFVEFFTVTIRNPNTREAYARAASQFFDWLAICGVCELDSIEPLVVAAYIEQHPGAAPTVKQHLAAIRMLFDWLVTGGVLPFNPAAAVRGPRYVVRRGKTPLLSVEQCRDLVSGIDVTTIGGLRDRALIGVMYHGFARVSAATSMNVRDYYSVGSHWMIRLHEKGGKHHEVKAHHTAARYCHEYLEAAAFDSRDHPLFPTLDKRRRLTNRRMNRNDVLRMLGRRARPIGLEEVVCCHTFRATGITEFRRAGGSLEKAQWMAAHESARTTKLYDRTEEEVSLDEIERIPSI